MRVNPAARRITSANTASLSSGSWIPLGPVPLASDASGNGTQDYGQVAGRVTAVAIDPADGTGNTVYLGAAQGGVWKSINAAYSLANNVGWTPLTDKQATLAIGAIAIQPGNSDPSKSVVLAATGEANNSADSYFGLGILRSIDAGTTWSLVSQANNGSLSFSGLGGTRMAFSSASRNTVVAAMATSSEAFIEGAANSSTVPGLYTSLNAGQSWTYNAIIDPGGATDPTSATSVVYNGAANSGAGAFFAAVRYHGFYSSPDGVQWTRLAAQPGGTALSASVCPAQSSSNNRACPIYRGEISIVPGRNEMYVWYVFLDAYGIPQDGGMWQSMNGGASWNAISDAGITNCGDIAGCGVEQGAYNLAILAVPNGAATDLYAGAINIYKCAINSANPTCSSAPFMNLTHVFGCVPAGAPAHAHPNQHAIAAMIPSLGTDSGNELLYFANDGGLYRALDGRGGLNSGSCSGTNQFDDLNQNLGSLAQFVSFAQHPTDANILLGGTQGNGSAATNHANSSTEWRAVLGGDGGYNAIDPVASSNWYASNPDLPPGGLGIQLCSSGVNCNNGLFNFVVTSGTLGGDDGAFYFPYILDSSTAILVGTCRVWRGPRTGGSFTALSPNFDSLGSGTCSGSEVNQVRALAAAGPVKSSDGSSVIYATTSGLGRLGDSLTSPPGGRVWVTTDSATGIYGFVDVTESGPQGNINPNQFPVSSAAADPADPTGNTAYVGVMGFTGGPGHIWKTTNAGVTWIDFTANLPDSPVNAIVVYPPLGQVYVGTDVGVFASSTSTPDWVELGPDPGSNQPGYLPNVPVTALGIFASGGQQLLRASTYGRGVWQFNLVISPDFQMSVDNTPRTAFAGQTTTFNGTMTALNGYTSSVTLSCVAGSSSPPSVCSPSPLTLTPGSRTPFTVSASGTVGDYNFAIQGVGSDMNQITQKVPLTLHLISFAMTAPSPARVTVPRGTASPTVSFQITAAGSFNQTVDVSCTTTIANARCTPMPSTSVTPTSSVPVNMTASVEVPAGTTPGTYTATIQATTAGAPSALTASFSLNVTSNPDFIFTEPASFPQINAGSSGAQATIMIGSQDGFSGTVSLSCSTTYGASSCSVSPSSVSSFPATATVTISGISLDPGTYTLEVLGVSGAVTHPLDVTFNIGDYSVTGTQSLFSVPGRQAVAKLKVASAYGYGGKIDFRCDATALPAALCSITPSNPVSVASGGTTNVTVAINPTNDAAAGTYNIKLDSQDTTGTPSHSFTISLTIGQDFVLTSSTTTQTVRAGQTSGAYNLTIQPVGNTFDAPVSLACTEGLPVGARCNFSPSPPITPRTSAINVVMSISTQDSKAALGASFPYAMLSLPLSLALTCWGQGSGYKASRRVPMLIALAICSMLAFFACSGVSSGGGGGSTPPPGNPTPYQVTVTASSPGTPSAPGHTVVVTLIVD